MTEIGQAFECSCGQECPRSAYFGKGLGASLSLG